MLMTTIILNKYQHHLFKFSSLVFNNSLQSHIRKPRMRHTAFVWKSSSILVASSPCNLSSDILFSTLTWSTTYFPCLIELFPPCKPFHGEYAASRDGGITVALLVESYNRISIYRHFPNWR